MEPQYILICTKHLSESMTSETYTHRSATRLGGDKKENQL